MKTTKVIHYFIVQLTQQSVLLILALALIGSSIGLPPLSWGTEGKDVFKGAYLLYKKGAYVQALDELKKVKPDSTHSMLLEHWMGLCHSRLQAFDLAIVHLEKAYKLGSKAEDLEYEIGQAYYASNQLREARGWFEKSLHKNFKAGASLYYIGFVHQVLEEDALALETYEKILLLVKDPEQVKQPALLQIAEIKLGQTEKSKSKITKTEAIAAFQKAADFDPHSNVGKQALLRLSQLKNMGLSSIPRMRNGTPIAAQAHYVKFSEDLKYDTNVITQADQSLTQVSNAASFLAKTSLFVKHEWIHDLEWVFSPEFDLSHTIHTRRDTPSVFQNDNINFTSALRTRYEYTWMTQPASFLFDLEFNYMLRDYLQAHRYPFYSRYYNLMLGQRAHFIDAGNTSLTINAKLASNEDPGQNAFDPGLSLSQNYRMGAMVSLNGSFNFDFNRARDAINEKINYRFSFSSNFISLLGWADLGFTFDFTLVDTRSQKATRGTEKTYSPTLTLKHQFVNGLLAGLNYNYTKNSSLDAATYAYRKQVFGLNVGYQF